MLGAGPGTAGVGPPTPARGAPWRRQWGWRSDRSALSGWASQLASERGATPRKSSLLPRPAQPPPPPAGPRRGEDAPQEPGSRASASPTPPTPRPPAVTRDRAATWPWLGHPRRPAPPPGLSGRGKGPSQEGAFPARPWHGDSWPSPPPPSWRLCSRGALGPSPAGHETLPLPQGRQPKVGLPRPLPPATVDPAPRRRRRPARATPLCAFPELSSEWLCWTSWWRQKVLAASSERGPRVLGEQARILRGPPSACVTPANCREAAPSSAFPLLQPAVDLGLGIFLDENERALPLHWAVLLFSGGKRRIRCWVGCICVLSLFGLGLSSL